MCIRDSLSAAVLVFGQKVKGIAGESSLQLVSVKVAGELVSLLAEIHRKVNGRTIEVGDGEPSSGHGGGVRRQKRRDQQQ